MNEIKLMEIVVIKGLAVTPFTLAEVGNPTWWRCPKCAQAFVRAIYSKQALYGFRCVTLPACGYEWHYQQREPINLGDTIEWTIAGKNQRRRTGIVLRLHNNGDIDAQTTFKTNPIRTVKPSAHPRKVAKR